MEVLSTLRADTRVLICPARMQYAEEFEPAGGSAGAVFYPVCLHCAQCGFNFFQDVELLTPYFLKQSQLWSRWIQMQRPKCKCWVSLAPWSQTLLSLTH